MSSAALSPRAGRDAQCRAISSSSPARLRPVFRRRIRSRRSCSALMTACVFVSPVRLARVAANSSVLRFEFQRHEGFTTCSLNAASNHSVDPRVPTNPACGAVRAVQVRGAALQILPISVQRTPPALPGVTAVRRLPRPQAALSLRRRRCYRDRVEIPTRPVHGPGHAGACRMTTVMREKQWADKYPNLGTSPLPTEPYICEEHFARERDWSSADLAKSAGRRKFRGRADSSCARSPFARCSSGSSGARTAWCAALQRMLPSRKQACARQRGSCPGSLTATFTTG